MRLEEERQQLREENTALRGELQRKDEELQQACKTNQDLREGLKQAIEAISSLREHNKDGSLVNSHFHSLGCRVDIVFVLQLMFKLTRT